MFEYLKSILPKYRSGREIRDISGIETMTWPEVFQWVQHLPDSIEIKESSALTRRLYEIVLYDNRVSSEHRAAAADCLKVLKLTVETSLENNPEALAAYRKACSFMEENVYLHGVGSLAWLIKENEIAPNDVLSYVTRPEHLPLLENFCTWLLLSGGESVRHQIEQYSQKK